MGAHLTLTGVGNNGGGIVYLLRDLFADANGTGLAAHTMDVGSGWTVHTGTVTIQSNRARTSSAPGIATADAGQADCDATVITNATADAGGAGLVVRFTDANNCWIFWLDYNASSFDLYEVNGGVSSVRASAGYNPAAAVDQTIVGDCSGAALSATVNGANPISYGSATHNQTATRVGIRGFQTSTEAHDFDTFEVTG